ncbi:MAG TPA: VWA domain-containing protein [Bacteroidia bacterium]|nr:VWA domain-containing protein [Bacteroidia bacterium]
MMNPTLLFLRVLLALALSSVLCAPARAQSTVEPARVIVVFDASGSMAGHIEGRPKIDVAKETVGKIVSGIDPAVELGLMAYGHRRKGDCKDIELLVPPAAGSGNAVLSALAGLNPVGKTPLTDAVVQAAEHLRYTESKASVILVSDGEETCDQDPCSVATKLEAAGIDFTCHVIGFALKPGESIGLECLAKGTGGLYLPADSVAGLMNALQEAVKQVMTPVSRIVAEPKLASGGPIIDGATFKLLTASGEEIASGSGGRWSPDLPQPGQYLLLAERDGKALKAEIEVAPGETVTKELVFTETGIKASAHETDGGPAFESGVAWTLYGPATAAGERPQVALSYDSKPFLRVDVGTYLLRAERGGAVAEREVEVGDGAPLQVAVILGSGSLKLAATIKEGQPPISKGLAWDILGDPDAEGDRPSKAFSYDPQPTLTLPAGKYLVKVVHGDATAQREIEVTAGQTTEVVLSLESGKVKASALLEEGGEPIASNLAWEVFAAETDLEGNRKSVAFSYDNQPTFTLPSGKYLVQAVHGSAKSTAEISVEAGVSSEIALILGAGKLRLSALPAPGAKPLESGLSWEVLGQPDLEDKRESVAFSYDGNPTLSIPAGSYTVTLVWGNAKASQDVVIEAGKLTDTAIVLNAGIIVADAVMGEGGKPVTSDLAWTLETEADAEGNRADAGFSYDPNPRFQNSAGKYLLKVARGAAKAEAEVEVHPNQQTKVTLNLKAGVLKVKATTDGAWAILGEPEDGEGDPVDLGFSYDKEATFQVPAGKVTVRRSKDDKTAEQQVEVGENKLVEITLDAK